jgi:tetratricopeptide (TPR) repeat protein
MRSNLFASTLAIALGVASPIVGAIGLAILAQPETALAGAMIRQYSIKKTSTYTIDEKARDLAERANILDVEGQYEKAIEYAFSSYLMSKKSGDLIAESRALFILGQIHFYHLKQYEKSLDYLKKSLKIIENTNDIFFQIHTLCSIGNSLSELGRTEEAISTFQLALQIYENKKNINQGNDENIAFMSLNINLLESYILNPIQDETRSFSSVGSR